jgi:hypothetical protein
MNITLSKEEINLKENAFTSNLILFWLKSNFLLTNKRLIIKHPNTLFGLIPLGYKQIDQPLKTIASISCSTQFILSRFIVGALILFLGIKTIGTGTLFGTILFIAIGVLNIVNCYTTKFVILNSSGQKAAVYELSILEKEKVQMFVSQINTQIAEL